MYSLRLIKMGDTIPIVGVCDQLPQPGQPFQLYSGQLRDGRGGVLRTSLVVEILGAAMVDGVESMRFRTINSTYQVSRIEPIVESIVDSSCA